MKPPVRPLNDLHRLQLAKAFATPHLAEIGLSVFAVIWGAAQLATEGETLVATGKGFWEPEDTLVSLIGVVPLLAGLVGLIAMRGKRRAMRMVSSAVVMPIWACLAAFYWTYHPPFTGGVVTYAMAAFAEAIIWVRVRYRFDQWAVV